ncbi:MAG: hypothetical protein R3C02_21795 [Planctomycetaceae bacterium]
MASSVTTCSLQFQELQQHRHGGNLVRLLSDRHLPQHEPRVGGKGRDCVQRRLTSRLIERTPQRLPVDGDPRLRNDLGKLIDPLDAWPRGTRLCPAARTRPNVVRRHPMRQFDVIAGNPVEFLALANRSTSAQPFAPQIEAVNATKTISNRS